MCNLYEKAFYLEKILTKADRINQIIINLIDKFFKDKKGTDKNWSSLKNYYTENNIKESKCRFLNVSFDQE